VSDEKSPTSSGIPPLQPRDILSPAATLLGFIFASLGIAIGFAPEESDFLNNFLNILIFTVSLIIISAFLTVITSLTQRRVVWLVTRVVYAFTWIFLGYIVIILLIGRISGIESLQIQLPQFNFSGILLISGIFSAISIFILFQYRLAFRKDLESASDKIQLSTLDIETAREAIDRTLLDDYDKQMALLKLTIEIERILREFMESLDDLSWRERSRSTLGRMTKILGERKIISKSLEEALFSIGNVRNAVVHEGEVDNRELDIALELSAKVLWELKQVQIRAHNGSECE